MFPPHRSEERLDGVPRRRASPERGAARAARDEKPARAARAGFDLPAAKAHVAQEFASWGAHGLAFGRDAR